MHQREPELVAHEVITPDFVDADVIGFRQPPRDIHHVRGHVKEEVDAQPAECRPLRERFEVVDRLARFDFDDRLESPATVL